MNAFGQRSGTDPTPAPGRGTGPDSGDTAAGGAAERLPQHVTPALAGDPSMIGPYPVLGRISTGPTGTVYLSRAVGGAWVAVRLIHPPPGGGDDAAIRARFTAALDQALDRARSIAGPGTCAVLDAGLLDPTAPGQPATRGPDPHADGIYLVTEFVDGPTLAREVAERGPLSPGELRRLALVLLDAVDRAHPGAGGQWQGRQWRGHGDLAPDDIILSITGPRLVDLGVAGALRPLVSGGAADPAGRQAAPLDADLAAWARIVSFAGTGRLDGWQPSGTSASTASAPRSAAEIERPVSAALDLAAAHLGAASATGGAARRGRHRAEADSKAILAALRDTLGRPASPASRRPWRRRTIPRTPELPPAAPAPRAPASPGTPAAKRPSAGSPTASAPAAGGPATGGTRRRRTGWRPVAVGVVTALATAATVTSAVPSAGPSAVTAGAAIPIRVEDPEPDSSAGSLVGGYRHDDAATDRPPRPAGTLTAPPDDPAAEPADPSESAAPAADLPGQESGEAPAAEADRIPPAPAPAPASRAAVQPPRPQTAPAPVAVPVDVPAENTPQQVQARTAPPRQPAAPSTAATAAPTQAPPAAPAQQQAGTAATGATQPARATQPTRPSSTPAPSTGLTPVQIGVVPLTPR